MKTPDEWALEVCDWCIDHEGQVDPEKLKAAIAEAIRQAIADARKEVSP